jgi:hypothetical protein
VAIDDPGSETNACRNLYSPGAQVPQRVNRDSNQKIILTAENLGFLALNSYIPMVPFFPPQSFFPVLFFPVPFFRCLFFLNSIFSVSYNTARHAAQDASNTLIEAFIVCCTKDMILLKIRGKL